MTYRIANRHDLVPQLPSVIPLPYEHVNTGYELVPPQGKVSDSLPCMHYLSTYLRLMDQQGGGGTVSLDPACKPET